MEAQLPVQQGDVLAGKYRVERVLGQGGVGVVVAARHLELQELYAIKLLLPKALANAQAVDRFLREARASARLKGEHVAKVHDVGRLETGAPYMVMEFLAGSDLQQVVRQRGPLPVEEASAYMLQACEAIAEAHSLGIIHRDIKPANLFLCQRPNGTPCIKVLDFGISKQITRDGLELTTTGTVLGSPLYMSPEQMARTKDADARSDVWAMGVVFYELLTAVVPFSADTLAEVIARVLQEEQVPPSRLRPGLPPEVDAIVARCLQKRPEHRFQSIHELAVALRPLVGMAEAWLGAGAWSHDPTAPRVERASYPGAAPARASHWGVRTAMESTLEAGPGAVEPAAETVPGLPTGAPWGRTDGGSSSSKGTGKAIVVAGLVFGVVALGSVWMWLAWRPSPDSAAVPQVVSVEPAAAPAEAPAPHTTTILPVEAVPAPGIEAPVAASPTVTPVVSAKRSPSAPPRVAKAKSGASGSSSSVPSKTPPVEPSVTAAPSASTPKKPKHEGIF